jgi:hypothetical protein
MDIFGLESWPSNLKVFLFIAKGKFISSTKVGSLLSPFEPVYPVRDRGLLVEIEEMGSNR